ncbi:hypothetical protein A2U01_0062180 [Trifolium medium]|uniref:Uncharacterized protein n=1 Tax=Trifolium medium TaxID=97028 RepID=A0A392RXR3_9FABA|nr:hypothetical protein [Trifolium medium]
MTHNRNHSGTGHSSRSNGRGRGRFQPQSPYQQPLWTTPLIPDSSNSGHIHGSHGLLHRVNI